ELLGGLSCFAPAADDEPRLVDDLELWPVGCSVAGDEPRRRQLRDEAFPSARERAFVQRPPVPADEFAQAKNRRPGAAEQLFERRAPFEQRPAAKVDRAFLQEV